MKIAQVIVIIIFLLNIFCIKIKCPKLPEFQFGHDSLVKIAQDIGIIIFVLNIFCIRIKCPKPPGFQFGHDSI